MKIKNVGVLCCLNENRITNGKKGCKQELTMYSILKPMKKTALRVELLGGGGGRILKYKTISFTNQPFESYLKHFTSL